MKTEYVTQEHKSITATVIVAAAIVTCALVTAFGDEIVNDELDPVSLLAIDSQQSDAELFSPDIQAPLHTASPDFGISRAIATSAANFAAAVRENLSQAGQPAAESKQVRKDNISPLPQNVSNRKTDELKNIIEQIRSIQFESQPITQYSSDTSPAKEPQPDKNASAAEHAETAEKKITESSADSAISAVNYDKSTSNQTLHKVEELLKDPNAIANPLELAEVLFQSGRPGMAGLCYKKALASIAADNPNVASERAWILFQIGNCLKDDDPNTSKESYAELIRTAPDSPWAQIAKSRHGLIEWYQQERPDNLIEELKR